MDGAEENSLGKGIISSSSLWELLLGAAGVPALWQDVLGWVLAAGDDPGVGLPVGAFLAPLGTRVVPFPGHFGSAHGTVMGLSLCLCCQHGPEQVLLQRVGVCGVSELLCMAGATLVFLFFFFPK